MVASSLSSRPRLSHPSSITSTSKFLFGSTKVSSTPPNNFLQIPTSRYTSYLGLKLWSSKRSTRIWNQEASQSARRLSIVGRTMELRTSSLPSSTKLTSNSICYAFILKTEFKKPIRSLASKAPCQLTNALNFKT